LILRTMNTLNNEFSTVLHNGFSTKSVENCGKPVFLSAFPRLSGRFPQVCFFSTGYFFNVSRILMHFSTQSAGYNKTAIKNI
jgi:hypothetical protein